MVDNVTDARFRQEPTRRRLRERGVFSVAVVGSLAITMGAATTLFAVVNAFLLSSLPYRNSDRLVLIWQHLKEGSEEEGSHDLPLSPGAFSDLAKEARSFEQMAAFYSESINATIAGEVERLHSLAVTGEFFQAGLRCEPWRDGDRARYRSRGRADLGDPGLRH